MRLEYAEVFRDIRLAMLKAQQEGLIIPKVVLEIISDIEKDYDKSN